MIPGKVGKNAFLPAVARSQCVGLMRWTKQNVTNWLQMMIHSTVISVGLHVIKNAGTFFKTF